MAQSLLNSCRKLNYYAIYRNLSSFNNNRTRQGILSILANEEVNVWSESNWSEFGKQFNKQIDFPLPGQTGVVVAKGEEKQTARSRSNSADKAKEESLSFLFDIALPLENQANKLSEAAKGFVMRKRMNNNLFNKSTTKQSFELQVFKCPVSLFKDFQTYFQLNSVNESDLSILTISFKTQNDMANWNAQVDDEREELMERFVDTAMELCSVLERAGSWADFIDPSSGRPFRSGYGYATFYETDERYRKLGFEIVDYGCCKVISHHKFGTNTYVGCLLTTASTESKIVQSLIEKFN